MPPIRNSATAAGSAVCTQSRARCAAVMPTWRSLRMCSLDPLLGLGLGQRLREQLLGLEDLDPAIAHHLAERVVLGLGLADPQHVVEEQLLRVRRREPPVFQPGRWTMTLRSFPTSECTPSAMAASTGTSGLSARSRRASNERAFTRWG